MEFRKAHRSEFYTKAIKINGYVEGKKGKVVYRTPQFSTTDISPETIALATELDKTLQEYLKGYLSRNKKEQVEVVSHDEPPTYDPSEDWGNRADIPDDSIPF